MTAAPATPAPVGILLANLGTPDAPTPAALRRYLAEFLSDRRVVDMPRLLWQPLLHGVILRTRPAKAARAYRSIWTDEGAPLLSISRRQQAGLQRTLEARFETPVKVTLGMRYGNPSLGEALDELRAAGAWRVLVLPLYPQYSAATTASTFDALARTFSNWRRLPELRFVSHYHDHPGYLDALAASVRERLAPEARLLVSFHGLPRRHVDEGDPYEVQCRETAQALARRLSLAEDRWAIAFQSRFGREEWLKPYTDELLREWAGRGVKRVQVVCPGFAADCLETLEEIAGENRALFLEAGGESFDYIPALNDREDHIRALADILTSRCNDWLAA